jgi:hypothetical protein
MVLSVRCASDRRRVLWVRQRLPLADKGVRTRLLGYLRSGGRHIRPRHPTAGEPSGHTRNRAKSRPAGRMCTPGRRRHGCRMVGLRRAPLQWPTALKCPRDESDRLPPGRGLPCWRRPLSATPHPRCMRKSAPTGSRRMAPIGSLFSRTTRLEALYLGATHGRSAACSAPLHPMNYAKAFTST